MVNYKVSSSIFGWNLDQTPQCNNYSAAETVMKILKWKSTTQNNHHHHEYEATVSTFRIGVMHVF
jgi:hypothetical protein